MGYENHGLEIQALETNIRKEETFKKSWQLPHSFTFEKKTQNKNVHHQELINKVKDFKSIN